MLHYVFDHFEERTESKSLSSCKLLWFAVFMWNTAKTWLAVAALSSTSVSGEAGERCQLCSVQSHLFYLNWPLKYSLLKYTCVTPHILMHLLNDILLLFPLQSFSFAEKIKVASHTLCLTFSTSLKCYPSRIKKSKIY